MHIDILSLRTRGAETNETTEGEKVREIALKHFFFKKKKGKIKKIDHIMNFVFQK